MKTINSFWVWLGEPSHAENSHVIAWWIGGLIVGFLIGGGFYQ